VTDADDRDASESSTPGAPNAGPAPAASAGAGARPGPNPGKLRDGTFAGAAIRVKYGLVQVRVVIAGGRLTDVISAHLPSADENSVQINAKAGPKLRQEALTAQSANIQTVSGATYTSTGYKSSLQAALDAARQV
jgi:uncharacterized protein with FMN-binding domain